MTTWVRFSFILAIGLTTSLLSANVQNPTKVFTEKQLAAAGQKYGPLAVKRLQAWQELVDDNIGRPEKTVLKAVNDFFNQAQFVSDQIHWKKSDYWATPIEFLGTDAGDCEDYVIAKYFTLKAIGIPEEKLYLTYVKAIRLNQTHMVLTYFETPKSIPLVLDNINKRIFPATKRNDLVPIYSFNGDGLWLSRQRGKGKEVKGGTQRLKKWNILLKKLENN
ncbi:transglutaminase-like cysteine peptidase [Thiomicrorhabdus sp. ZW0627]|uniref:transglutaminase-like cysteine peptidase n=1 Tax=Thiomicrorhabdus sp. ZW0627 TaxID=3039774 RepID=UPI002436C049|nr:transglutaminase-like cysteine peptidase [Thiomicrorhabdus sp. ZW0627]MDG6774468.1 transglutaminase-like cysteine peptidase [Thiomicrorhabdus sp. ZW0627]